MKIRISHRKNTPNKIEIVNKDLWSGPTNLAIIISAFLKKYIENIDNGIIISYPIFDVNLHKITRLMLDPSPEAEAEDEKGMELWRDKLVKMHYAFDSIANGEDAPEWDACQKEINDALEAAGLKPDIWWNEEATAIKAPIYEKYAPAFQIHEDKIKEGLELFGKHFRNLWD